MISKNIGVVLVSSDPLNLCCQLHMLLYEWRMQVSGRQSRDPGTPTLSVTLPPPGAPRCSPARPRRAAAGAWSSLRLVPPLSQQLRWAPTPPCSMEETVGGEGERVRRKLASAVSVSRFTSGQFTFQIMNHREKSSVFYQSNNGFLDLQ